MATRDNEEVAKVISEDKVANIIAPLGALNTTDADANLSRSSGDSEVFIEILNQLKILNLYMAEGFNFTFTEEDIEDDHDY